MSKETILKCEHMYKTFGVTKALVDVPLEVAKGEIRGLIGENGSGKSTISLIVAGVQPADEGKGCTMILNGEPYDPKNMIEAQSKGIAMVVQEKGTIDRITVAANIFVGKENRYTKMGILNTKKMIADAQAALEKIGVTKDVIDASRPIDEYDFEDRKLIEIARAMADDPQIFIVDETTTALAQRGRDIVYNIMRKMSAEGKAVLFISHDLDELMSICNAITVLRDGKFIATMTHEEMNVRQMRQYMVGREVSDNYYRSDHDGSYGEKVVLKAEGVTNGIVENFSFELHEGEILGIGGLSEAGMHEVGRAVFGADKILTGTVTLANGVKITNPRVAIKNKIAYASKNRDTESITLSDTIGNNITLPSIPQLEKFKLYIPQASEKQLAQDEIEELSVKCNGPQQVINELSGGNKQKVVFAKWIGNKSDILILDCPTRGIDIGVKEAMYKLMYQLKKEGKSIIMISEELPELLGMSDRVLILKDGKLSGTFYRDNNPTEQEVIHYMI